MFSRRRFADAATDVAEHLSLVESVKALRENDRKHDESIRSLEATIWAMQAEMRALKAETKHEAIIEVHNVSNSMQGWINQRIDALAIKIALLERAFSLENYFKKTSRRVPTVDLIVGDSNEKSP